MGSGKTTVGRRLAERLGRAWVDTDDVVERRAGRSIASIFAEDGEPVFRAREAAAVRSVLAGEPLVVSLGGGAVTTAAVREVLAGHVVVWLRARPTTLLDRLDAAEIAARPLLADDPLGALERLADQREPYHREVADLTVDVDDRNPDDVIDALVELVGAP